MLPQSRDGERLPVLHADIDRLLAPAPGREGSRSAHSPRRVALASASNFPRLSSLEYCRYHHARPAAPSSRFRTRLSGRHLDRIAVRDTNHAAGEVGEGRGDEQKNDDEDEKEYPFTSWASTHGLGVVPPQFAQMTF